MQYRLNSRFALMTVAAALVASSGNPLVARGLTAQAPDNTAVNKPDRDTNAPNADRAKNNQSDVSIMKHIRRDVVSDKSLSTYAHNVKIVAVKGKVTLRGPVKSEDEKKAIEEHATKYAGAGNVTNELTVKGS